MFALEARSQKTSPIGKGEKDRGTIQKKVDCAACVKKGADDHSGGTMDHMRIRYRTAGPALPLRKAAGTGGAIIQMRYYDPTQNTVVRPDETQEIRDAKKDAKQKAGRDDLEFTAHHKIPWEVIKGHMQDAFVVGSTQNPDAMGKWAFLEALANKFFPLTKQEFTQERSRREQLYNSNETQVDTWIQNVCWSPKNVFIGPLTNIRVDDPSRRKGGAATYDSHYSTITRSPSPRSRRLGEIAQSGRFNSADQSEVRNMEQTVAKYTPPEWGKYTLNGETKYYQKYDPYFENEIPISNLLHSDIRGARGNYTITLETVSNYEVVEFHFIRKYNRDGGGITGKGETLKVSPELDKKISSSVILIDRISNHKSYEIVFTTDAPEKTTEVLRFSALMRKEDGSRKEEVPLDIRA